VDVGSNVNLIPVISPCNGSKVAKFLAKEVITLKERCSTNWSATDSLEDRCSIYWTTLFWWWIRRFYQLGNPKNHL